MQRRPVQEEDKTGFFEAALCRVVQGCGAMVGTRCVSVCVCEGVCLYVCICEGVCLYVCV